MLNGRVESSSSSSRVVEANVILVLDLAAAAGVGKAFAIGRLLILLLSPILLLSLEPLQSL